MTGDSQLTRVQKAITTAAVALMAAITPVTAAVIEQRQGQEFAIRMTSFSDRNCNSVFQRDIKLTAGTKTGLPLGGVGFQGNFLDPNGQCAVFAFPNQDCTGDSQVISLAVTGAQSECRTTRDVVGCVQVLCF